MGLRKILILSLLVSVFILFYCGCIPVEDLGGYWEKAEVDPELEGHWTAKSGYIGRQFISFVKEDTHYKITMPTMHPQEVEDNEHYKALPKNKCKTLKLGMSRFLIINNKEYMEFMYEQRKKQHEEMKAALEKMKEELEDINEMDYFEEDLKDFEANKFNGTLSRYLVNGDELTLYLIDYEKLTNAVKQGELKGRVLEDGFEMTPPVIIKELNEEVVKFLERIAGDESWWSEEQVFERVYDLESALEEARLALEKQMQEMKEQAVRIEPETFTIKGSIVSDNNEPINEAKIQIYKYKEYEPYSIPEVELEDESSSDETGLFEFAATKMSDSFSTNREDVNDANMAEAFSYDDKLLIVAQKEGYAIGWLVKGVYNEPNCLIVLEEPFSLKGEVINTKDELVAGAEVRLILTTADSFHKEQNLYGVDPIDCLATRTDDEGLFEFKNLPEGAKVRFIVSAEGYTKLIISIPVN